MGPTAYFSLQNMALSLIATIGGRSSLGEICSCKHLPLVSAPPSVVIQVQKVSVCNMYWNIFAIFESHPCLEKNIFMDTIHGQALYKQARNMVVKAC